MTTASGSTTRSPAAAPGPSTRPAAAQGPASAQDPGGTPLILPKVGDLVLVRVDIDVWRPMVVTAVHLIPIYERITPTVDNPTAAPIRQERRVSGIIFCEPEDHTRPAFRGAVDRQGDPAQITGHPDRLLPLAAAENLAPGDGLGQWRTR